MNFAFCIFKYFPFGGLERDFTRIIQACQQNGHDIDVYTMKWEGEKPENLRITLIPSKGLTNHSRCNHFVKRFFSIIKTKNYNAIVGFNRMPKLDIYYAGDICYKDNVHNQHNFLYKLTKRYRVYSKFENAVFSRKSKTHIMYIAENVKGTYVKYYDTQKERFHFLTPGIDKKRIAIKNPKSAREKIRKLYKITGTFYASNGSTKLEYTAKWNDGTTDTTLTSGTTLTNQTGANETSINCSGGSNSTLTVTFETADMQAVPAGNYTDTVTLEVAPI